MIYNLKYFFIIIASGCVLGDQSLEDESIQENNNETISEYFVCLYDENEVKHFHGQFMGLQKKLLDIKSDIGAQNENSKSLVRNNDLQASNKQLSEGMKSLISPCTEELKNLRDQITNAQNEFLVRNNDLQASNKQLSGDMKSMISPCTEELKNLRDQIVELQNKLSNKKLPTNCNEAIGCSRRNGIYDIYSPLTNEKSYIAYCSDSTDNGGAWTVIQRRKDGSEDFYREWLDYRNGFGNLSGEFWLGLERIHQLTTETPHELLIKMRDDNGKWLTAQYDNFVIGKEHDDYPLIKLGEYSGNAGDSLSKHISNKFTTKDRDNDKTSSNCAEKYKGAWWYYSCYHCNLNGLYLENNDARAKKGEGISWNKYKMNYSLKYVSMSIRPSRNCLNLC